MGIVVPLELRYGMRLPAFGFGALVAVVLFMGSVLFRFLMEQFYAGATGPASHGFATRAALVASLSIGYTLAAWRWVPTAHAHDLAKVGLLPEPASSAGANALVGGTPEQLRRSRVAGLFGVLLFVLLVEVPSLIGGEPPLDAWLNLHTFSYMLGLGLIFFWVSGRLAYFTLGAGSPGDALQDIDLLDLRPVRALGRIGLRSALAWILGLSLGSVVFVFGELSIWSSLIVLVPLLLVTLAITLASLLVPMRGVHQRLRATKERELLAIEAAVRGEPGALATTRLAGRTGLGLADLLAYKQLVEDLPTWPFDSAGLRRLLLYLLIPVGSWIGGALVERMVGVFLD